jgi:uncharacterized protein YhaN
MRLRCLHIHGFGGVRARTVPLDHGLTVLLGPNEAGKSTTLHCLAQTLMGRPTQHSRFPDFAPWDGGPFAAAVEFSRGDAVYRLSRRFDESGPRAQALHRLDARGDTLVTQENAEIRTWLQAAFGTADDRVFYRVFCLTAAEFDPLDNFAGLREGLERVTSGAEVAVTAALARVDDRLAVVRRGVGQPALEQNWGAVKRAEEARKGWEARLTEARRQGRRLAQAREEAERLAGALADGSARQAEIAALLETERVRRELLNRLAELQTRWATLEGERERVERLVQEHDRLRARIVGLPAALADPAGVRTRLGALTRGADLPAWPGWASLGAGALVAAGGWHATHGWSLLALALGAAVGVPWLQHIARSARETRTFCAALAVRDLAEAGGRLEAAERYRRELDATALALQAVTDPAELAARRHDLAREIATTEAKRDALPGTGLTTEDTLRLARDAAALEDERPGLLRREKEILREVAILEASERDAIDLEDGVAYWRAEETRAREEEATLVLARELLVAAGQQAHDALAHPLAAAIAPLFAAMTGGRYPTVRVEGDAKAFRIFPLDAAGVPAPVEALSQGARAQFLLAVRLALGRTLAGPDGSPIFLLDDPLLHFDADRRREALALLARLATGMQIILATHDASILAALPGAAVVSLEGVAHA